MSPNAAIFSLHEKSDLAESLAQKLATTVSVVKIHRFPDNESCVRIVPGDVKQTCIVIASLNNPDPAGLPLVFLSETLREYGAERVILVAPYLAYMRQDQRFREGEGITARYFARLVSSYFDALITVDPHLHRIHNLQEVYSIPTQVIHAAPVVADWIRINVNQPLLIGPDIESAQWVRALAGQINVPFMVLEKVRHGDRDVDVSVPEVQKWLHHVPVLFDDIISTGRTMIETIGHLKRAGMAAPLCIGIHGLFAGQAYHDLIGAGAANVVTTNTIKHATNRIDLAAPIASAIREVL